LTMMDVICMIVCMISEVSVEEGTTALHSS